MDAHEPVKMLFAFKIPTLFVGLVLSICMCRADADSYSGVKQLMLSGQFKQVDISSVDSGSAVVIKSVDYRNKLSFHQTGDLLSIKTIDGDKNSIKGSSSIHGSITNVVIGENASSSISIGGNNMEAVNQQPRAKISITVPRDINIQLQGNIVNARIGDIQGKLVLDIGGASNIEVGSVHDVSANLAGSTSTHIDKIIGNLIVDMTGSGKLSVASGEIGLLNIATSGLGQVDVNAVADRATISVIGAGTVKVKHVNKKPEISVLGAGSVDVNSY